MVCRPSGAWTPGYINNLATYLLLSMRKQQGRSGRLLNAKPLKEFMSKLSRDGSSYSSDEDKENVVRRGRVASRRPVSYQQPLTPQNNQKTKNIIMKSNLKESDGVFSSSDSLDTDEILGGVGEFNSPMLVPKSNEAFEIRSRSKSARPTTERTIQPPNTVSITRRNIPRRASPMGSYKEP